MISIYFQWSNGSKGTQSMLPLGMSLLWGKQAAWMYFTLMWQIFQKECSRILSFVGSYSDASADTDIDVAPGKKNIVTLVSMKNLNTNNNKGMEKKGGSPKIFSTMQTMESRTKSELFLRVLRRILRTPESSALNWAQACSWNLFVRFNSDKTISSH